MYYPFFLTYIITGVTIGVLVFVWALKNEQFSDQQRARFLPLEDDAPAAIKRTGWSKYELVFLFALIVAGIAGSVALIAYALLSH